MPAPERVPQGGLTPGAPPGVTSAGPLVPAVTELLTHGELTVRGRLRDASNTALFCQAALDGEQLTCVYKPVTGERPLWDFPHGTLAAREVAAYLVSEATGWGLVPPTVLRDGPYGEGMCQLWIEADPQVELLALVEGEEPGPGWRAIGFAEIGEDQPALLVHADDERLRRLAVLDVVINNADRKGGHLLPTIGGQLYAIDHGVAFHTENKLRTLLWGWAGEPLTDEAREVLRRLSALLDDGGPDGLAGRLAKLLTAAEIDAVRVRVAALLRTGRHPRPGSRWPAIPWPPV